MENEEISAFFYMGFKYLSRDIQINFRDLTQFLTKFLHKFKLD